jgi:hypothetical protein
MNKIKIENYRGFDIEFDTNYEKFQCVITEYKTKESSSFTAVKKFIDDYKKENQYFVPFWVQKKPTAYGYKKDKLKVIGIRKDGRLMAEEEDGTKCQISDYDLSDYILFDEDNQKYYDMLKEQKEKEIIQDAKDKQIRDSIISKIKNVSLKEYKQTLI